MERYHISAMLEQTVSMLDCKPGKCIVDCTLGGCGHAVAILPQLIPHGRFIGIDRDPDAIVNAEIHLSPFRDIVELVHDNFKNLPAILDALGIEAVDGILVDLGISLHQVKCSARGFSFLEDGPLDMRMDPGQRLTAEHIVNTASEQDLADIFYRFGQERWSRRIAGRIVKERSKAPYESTLRLARTVESVVTRAAGKRGGIHPATRVFMALRIAVNGELEGLDDFIEAAVGRLTAGGRLCVLSFHSLEDRIVKQAVQRLGRGCTCPPRFPRCICNGKALVRPLTRKALRPGPREIAKNPMARSTRLRVIEKV